MHRKTGQPFFIPSSLWIHIDCGLNNGFEPNIGIKHPISFYKISKSPQERQKNYGVKFAPNAISWRPEIPVWGGRYPPNSYTRFRRLMCRIPCKLTSISRFHRYRPRPFNICGKMPTSSWWKTTLHPFSAKTNPESRKLKLETSMAITTDKAYKQYITY